MKNILKMLYKQLKGWNYTEYENTALFDFYSEDNKAILTMVCTGTNIALVDDVETYSDNKYPDYENLTLKQYDDLLKED